MNLTKRKKRSTRVSKSIPVKFYPNFSGQGGIDALIFESETEYFTITFDSQEEITALLSNAHIVAHNFSPTEPK